MYEFMFFVRIIFLLVAAFRQNNHAVHAGQYRGAMATAAKYPASSTRPLPSREHKKTVAAAAAVTMTTTNAKRRPSTIQHHRGGKMQRHFSNYKLLSEWDFFFASFILYFFLSFSTATNAQYYTQHTHTHRA